MSRHTDDDDWIERAAREHNDEKQAAERRKQIRELARTVMLHFPDVNARAAVLLATGIFDEVEDVKIPDRVKP